jgi:hypothetical protein
MITNAMCTLAVLSLMFVSAHAMAIPVLDEYVVIFSHSQGTLGAGLTIKAHTTDTAKLFLAGGYTIKCDSSSVEIKAEHKAATSAFQPNVSLTIKVPALQSPTSYSVPGWTNIERGSCTTCGMQHRWEAADSTDTSVSVGLLGTGVNFSLVPTAEVGFGDTAVLGSVCRPVRPPQCCTPGCIPP